MPSTMDDLKARVRQAAGDLLDDPELKREGALDKLSADAKRRIDELAGRLGESVDSVRDAIADILSDDDEEAAGS